MPTFRFVGLGNWLMRRRFLNPLGYSRHPKQPDLSGHSSAHWTDSSCGEPATIRFVTSLLARIRVAQIQRFAGRVNDGEIG
jgi:hypothetical protein